MRLKQQYLDLIESDLELQGKLAKATGKSIQTPVLWVKNELHEKLLMLPVLNVILQHTGAKSVEELVEQPAAV